MYILNFINLIGWVLFSVAIGIVLIILIASLFGAIVWFKNNKSKSVFKSIIKDNLAIIKISFYLLLLSFIIILMTNKF